MPQSKKKIKKQTALNLSKCDRIADTCAPWQSTNKACTTWHVFGSINMLCIDGSGRQNASYCGTTCSKRQSFQTHRATYKGLTAGMRSPHTDVHDARFWVTPRGTCQLCHRRQDIVLGGGQQGSYRQVSVAPLRWYFHINLAPDGISRYLLHC